LVEHALAGLDAEDAEAQLVRRPLLEQVPVGAGVEHAQDVLLVAVHRDDEHPHLGGVLLDRSRGLQTADVRETDIHQDDVRAQFDGEADRLTPGGRLADDREASVPLEDVADAGADDRVVVDEEDADLRRRRSDHRVDSRYDRSGRHPTRHCRRGDR
jgi:hypothetical protein